MEEDLQTLARRLVDDSPSPHAPPGPAQHQVARAQVYATLALVDVMERVLQLLQTVEASEREESGR